MESETQLSTNSLDYFRCCACQFTNYRHSQPYVTRKHTQTNTHTHAHTHARTHAHQVELYEYILTCACNIADIFREVVQPPGVVLILNRILFPFTALSFAFSSSLTANSCSNSLAYIFESESVGRCMLHTVLKNKSYLRK